MVLRPRQRTGDTGTRLQPVSAKKALGVTGLDVPPLIFGTSCLGNLYTALPWETKLDTVREFLRWVKPPVVLDSAGKYGAGLSLEVLGKALRQLGVAPGDVIISNKLGWVRVPLRGPEPTFEPGVWGELKHDAEQRIGHEGILRCWEQGCRLLGAPYQPQLVSVHDPDEYLAAADSEEQRRGRWSDILGAYRALFELKRRGEVKAVGVGSKDWTVVRDLAEAVDLDWVMLACSLTLYRHPPELLDLVESLRRRGVSIVNSAVFNAGFLVGGRYFDYRRPDSASPEDRPLFRWRDRFLALCRQFSVSPAAACVQFALSPPGVVSVALNTSRPSRVAENAAIVSAEIPREFWTAARDAGLVASTYPYV